MEKTMNLERIKKREQRELKESALYEVWKWMQRQATREYLLNLKFGIKKPRPVDESFMEFEGFMLWAVLEKGYDAENDTGKIITRIDVHGTWSPENCYFIDRKDLVKQDESLEEGITKGSSSVRYRGKDERGRWNGLSNTRLYEIWKGMCRRCSDPKQKDYPDYGARGICVCDEWRKNFLAFEEWAWDHGYSVDLSIDRIDVDGNYCPENCRWAGFLEQKINTRSMAKTYQNVRLKVSRMRGLLGMLPDNAVVTLVVRRDCMPKVDVCEDDYPSVPKDERIDKTRAR